MNSYWYEDPLADEDIYNYVKLREKATSPSSATGFPAGGLDTFPVSLTEKRPTTCAATFRTRAAHDDNAEETAHLAEAFGLAMECTRSRQFIR